MNKLSILSILMCALVSCASASCGAGSSNSDASATSSNEDDVNYFDYYPLDDGTLGIKQGKTLYLSKIAIPSSYQGRTVTRILSNGFGLGPKVELCIPKTIRVIDSKGVAGTDVTLTYDGTVAEFSALVDASPKDALNVYGTLNCSDGVRSINPNRGIWDPNPDFDSDSLDYYPLDDGTLGVKEGNARYLSKIVIPDSRQGRNVTRILSDGFHLVDRGELYIPATIRFVESKGISGRNITLIYDGSSQQFASLYRGSESSAFSSATGNVVCTDGSLFLDPIDGLIGEAGGYDTDDNDLSHGASITYWCPETDSAFFAEKVKSFKAAHPEFKGDITKLASIGEGDLKGELTKDPEVAADVFEIADDNIPDCVTGRAMTAFDNDDVTIMKNRYGDAGVEASTVKGKVYGVPYRNDNGYVLSYDTSIVSAEQAKTVEGIIAACKAAGATFNFNLTNSWYTFAPIWAAGGKTYTDENGVFHSEIATDAIAEVAAGFAKIVADAGTTWNHSDDDANFGASTRRVGAVVKWNNEAAESKKLGDKLGITVLPSFSVGGKSYPLKSFQGYKALGMRRAEAFTVTKKITARAFCLFMGSDEVAEERLTTLKQGVPNESVIAKTSLWDSKWLSALGAQQAAGNTVSQANGSSNYFWSAAEALGNAIKGGTVTTKEAMLDALIACQTVQNS